MTYNVSSGTLSLYTTTCYFSGHGSWAMANAGDTVDVGLQMKGVMTNIKTLHQAMRSCITLMMSSKKNMSLL